MKKCTKCQQEKELTEFRFRTEQNRHATRCKSCDSISTKARFFNVTHEELVKFIESQGHVCSICGISEREALKTNKQTKHYGLYIDHCHRTSKLRGTLCHNCNLIIGHAKDNIGNLKKAIEYLT